MPYDRQIPFHPYPAWGRSPGPNRPIPSDQVPTAIPLIGGLILNVCRESSPWPTMP